MKKLRTPSMAPSTTVTESGVVVFTPIHVPKEVVRGLLKNVAARRLVEKQNGIKPRS